MSGIGLSFGVDWGELFVPDSPLLRVFVRGRVIYVVIFFHIRVIPNRQVGGVRMNGMLLFVLNAAGDVRGAEG